MININIINLVLFALLSQEHRLIGRSRLKNIVIFFRNSFKLCALKKNNGYDISLKNNEKEQSCIMNIASSNNKKTVATIQS